MKKLSISALTSMLVLAGAANAAPIVVATEGFVRDGVNKAKTYADTVASTAETNAKTYADTVASAAETNAKAYADTVEDTAVSAAVDAVAGKQDKIGDGTSGTVITNTGTAGSVGSISIDTVATTGSSNLITSDAVKAAVDGITSAIPTNVQAPLSGTNGNVVAYTGTDGTLTERAIDTTVGTNADNLITSGAVQTAVNTVAGTVAGKQDKIGDGTSGTVITNTGTAGSVGSIGIDTVATTDSSNLITSGAVQVAVAEVSSQLSGTPGNIATYSNTAGVLIETEIDVVATTDSSNLITSGAVFTGLAGKQDAIVGGAENVDKVMVGTADGYAWIATTPNEYTEGGI
jgi:hypothetical protein